MCSNLVPSFQIVLPSELQAQITRKVQAGEEVRPKRRGQAMDMAHRGPIKGRLQFILASLPNGRGLGPGGDRLRGSGPASFRKPARSRPAESLSS